MKICNKYSHLSALEIIRKKPTIYKEVEQVLNDKSLKFGRGNTHRIKKKISQGFNDLGWADKTKVGHGTSKLTINFLKSKVGLCFQIGNVSRTYADILKICYLGNEEIIDAGIIVVPNHIESNILGANYAKYDRLEREITLFESITKTPILILGLSN